MDRKAESEARRVAAAAAFGTRLREIRTAQGLTQDDLFRASGLAVVQISRIERGAREVRLTTILRLVDALNVEPNDLLAGLTVPTR